MKNLLSFLPKRKPKTHSAIKSLECIQKGVPTTTKVSKTANVTLSLANSQTKKYNEFSLDRKSLRLCQITIAICVWKHSSVLLLTRLYRIDFLIFCSINVKLKANFIFLLHLSHLCHLPYSTLN